MAVVSKASVCTWPSIILKGTWWRCAFYAYVFGCKSRLCVCVYTIYVHAYVGV